MKFIVNHATVQAIFCVAETLNSVSSSICCFNFLLFFRNAYLDDSEIKKKNLLSPYSNDVYVADCFPLIARTFAK